MKNNKKVQEIDKQACKIHDAFINETFECNVVENRSLGDGFKDVLVVKNIYYVDETVQSAVE